MKQVFDVDAVDVFSRRDFSQSERQFARGVGKNTRKTAAGEIENARVERDRRACRHREDHSTEKSLSVLRDSLCLSGEFFVCDALEILVARKISVSEARPSGRA